MSEQDRKVLEAIDSKELVDLFRSLIRIPSVSRSKEEAEVGLFLKEYLEKIDLTVSLQKVEKDRFNVIATLKGLGGGKTLLLNGHMDVNSPGAGWTKDPFGGVIEDGYMFGMGAVNMKGGDAALVMAVHGVKKVGIALRGDVILSFVVGELQGGIGTIRMLEQGVRADAFILAEPSELLLLIRHTGMVHIHITTIGRTCHISSQEKGINAIQSMYEVIRRIEEISGEGGAKLFERVNVGSIKGGLSEEYHSWRPSLLPDYCTATFDFRIPPGQTEGTLLEGIKKVTEKVKEQRRGLEIKTELVRPPSYYHMPPFGVDKNEEIVKLVKRSHKMVTGQEPGIADFPPYLFFASDASHLSTQGGMPGVIYGPGGETVSQPNERIRVDDVLTAAKVYALTILRFCS
jgi:acetylornithine deacetylase